MDSPSAIVIDPATGNEVAFTQFYGYTADAPALGGCTAGVDKCFSTVTLMSIDKGASWQFRSAIHWDGTRMPEHSVGR
jgi:hypothetical protein